MYTHLTPVCNPKGQQNGLDGWILKQTAVFLVYQMENLPKHVALIMDGNRRWAKEKNLPQLEGHRKGEERIEPIVDTAIELGIPYLTFWAFSTENWNRTPKEVSFLLHLYRTLLDKKIDNFHKKNVRAHVIGNLGMFPQDLQDKTKKWIEKTKYNKKITVNIALSYGGRDEIIRAINKWHNNLTMKQFNHETMTKEKFNNYLDTAGQPDPDLLIRTGGVQRLSGFMIWQTEYTEFYFTETLWPDFTPEKFKEAIEEYFNRQRRFGK